MPVADLRDRTSGINLSQIETFLALVEEGSVVPALKRLGLGRSSLSAHVKSLSDELGQRLVIRLQGGLAVTPVGREAYRLLLPFMEHAAHCLAYFRSREEAVPRRIEVALPQECAGGMFDRAFIGVARSAMRRVSPYWVTPRYGRSEPTDRSALVVNFGDKRSGGPKSADVHVIADRWVVVRAGPNKGWSTKDMALSELVNNTFSVPELPENQLALLLAIAEKTQARINCLSQDLQEILANGSSSRNFSLLIPAAQLNPNLVSDQFECALLEKSDFDPTITISGEYSAVFGPELCEQYKLSLASAMATKGLAPANDTEPERISLKLCRSFLALYEEGNMRRASQRLCIVQPALTVQLHGLEELLEAQLFERSHRGLEPNSSADFLYSLLAPLMAEFEGAVRTLRAGAVGGRLRRLRLGLIPALDAESETAEYFANALNRWSERYPETIVRVLEAYSAKLLQWLLSGRIDFALTDRVVESPEMCFDLIAEDEMAVVVERSTQLLPPGPVTLETASRLPLVLPSNRHGLRSIIAQPLQKAGLELNPRIEVDSMAAALSLVKIGRYATILPTGAIHKSTDRRRLSIHTIHAPRVLRSICLVRMRNDILDPAAQEFIEELRSAFSSAGERIALEPNNADDHVASLKLMA
ncbi:LysR family transcriptional regulator [Bradyrhizobium sp. INPA01-394B]|uniref:LysR family transcriptional regulator n=1 Tax=Bradyrhizobium campsiandrae TaxID=1729892 RepID=A0ABR7U4Z0_9BRAD|nr:LysR substrate-binding domain-containing protein [Bradyrhizobium campsiandrae]MBC9879901.1 LysR family transcriptional regulator [Bradyrhizobium campsiandrae]MBC9978586.1 LysR family transcriptional regulator [Bradyrhizobium campsiandrae]